MALGVVEDLTNRPQELVINLETGMAHDQDASPEMLAEQEANAAQQKAREIRIAVREAAIFRLKKKALLGDQDIADILTVMGIDI